MGRQFDACSSSIGAEALLFISKIRNSISFQWKSHSATRLALSVALVLIIVQSAFVLPILWGNEQRLLRQVDKAEFERVSSWLDKYNSAVTNVPLSPGLIGITLLTSGDTMRMVSASGDAPQYTQPLPDLKMDGSVARFVERNENIGLSRWLLGEGGQQLTALVRLDVSDQVAANRALALRQFLYILISSLLVAFAVSFLAKRFFVAPINKTLESIRATRSSGAKMQVALTQDSLPEMNLVSEEFNGLIDEQKKAARQVKVKQQYLEYAAHHDPLTHLGNRLMFESCLKTTVAESFARDEKLAMILIDLDNFKFFNDQYGHMIGDKMVVEIASRLQTMVRNIDMVARLDGDEFVIIQKDVNSHDDLKMVAERIMAEIGAPFEYRGYSLKVTVSVGMSFFPNDVSNKNDEELACEEIVNNAFVALQEAKTNGKAQYQIFNDSMRQRLTERIRIEQNLKTALENNEFEVYYQPKINAVTRQVTGAEALVRWHHPTDGKISPEIFVPVAEEAGLIIEIGEWILRTACRQTHMLQQIGFEGLQVAVNISTVQFTDGNLLPMVSKALRDSNLAPELLELEITESAVMHDPEDVIHSLHELSRFGMRLAIDDFGTGYSSLAYLKRFPVDTLKIDRAFITDVSSDNDDMAIVEAVIGLGQHFNMKIVAEGVEDEDQLHFLARNGCDLAQGYYVSRPMTMKDYIAWLEKWPHGVQPQNADSNEDIAAQDDDVLPLKRAS